MTYEIIKFEDRNGIEYTRGPKERVLLTSEGLAHSSFNIDVPDELEDLISTLKSLPKMTNLDMLYSLGLRRITLYGDRKPTKEELDLYNELEAGYNKQQAELNALSKLAAEQTEKQLYEKLKAKYGS